MTKCKIFWVVVFLFFFVCSAVSADSIKLPEVDLDDGLPVARSIYQRRSVRTYSSEPVTLDQAGQILWAAGGKTVDGITGPTRAYPSAGGLYPLDIYLVAGEVEGISPGLYRYMWENHSLELIREGDIRTELSQASLGQGSPRSAPMSIVISADTQRVASRYGRRGEELFVPLDTGHLAQNVNLQAESIGLSCLMIGAFSENDLKDVLGITEGKPVYVITVGRS